MDKVKQDLKRIYPPNMLRMILTLLFSVCEAITVSLASMFVSNTVEGVVNGTLSLISADFLLTFLLVLGAGICVSIYNFSKTRVVERAGIVYRTFLFNKSLSNYNIVKKLNPGYSFAMLCECFILAKGKMERKIMLISNTLKIIIISAFMAYYSVFALLFVFLFFGLFTLSNHFINVKMQKSIADFIDVMGKCSQFFLQGIKGSRELTYLRKEEYYAKKYDEKIVLWKKSRDRLNVLNGIQGGAIQGMTSLINFGAAIVSVIFFALFDMPMFAVLSVFMLSGNIVAPLLEYSEIISGFTQDRERVKIAEQNFYCEEKSEENELSAPLKKIEFNIKGFSYKSENKDKSETLLLKNLSEKILEGEFVVVKGESGSGKSTLFKLLGKSEELNECDGQVLFNGEDSRKISRKSLNNSLFRVRQKNTIFEDTLLNNLSLGENYSLHDIEEVLETACLKDFEKEYGLNLCLSENGSNISEGQKQRICIARVLLRKPKFLLLDEPTSALDKITADNILNNIKAFAKKHNTAVIMISHKSSDVMFADKVIEIMK